MQQTYEKRFVFLLIVQAPDIREAASPSPYGLYAYYGYERLRILLGKMPLYEEALARRAEYLELLSLVSCILSGDLNA